MGGLNCIIKDALLRRPEGGVGWIIMRVLLVSKYINHVMILHTVEGASSVEVGIIGGAWPHRRVYDCLGIHNYMGVLNDEGKRCVHMIPCSQISCSQFVPCFTVQFFMLLKFNNLVL